MASKKSKLDVETIGPAQQDSGPDPANPQDRLFNGALPILAAQAVTLRRPFSEPVRPPLHYSDGGGPDEAVTSRRPNVIAPLGNTAALAEHFEDRPIAGTDKNKYSGGPDNAYTSNGVEIRGT